LSSKFEPNTPTAEELENPESIVAWYIDGNGNAVPVPNGRYDPATRTVSFNCIDITFYTVIDYNCQYSCILIEKRR